MRTAIRCCTLCTQLNPFQLTVLVGDLNDCSPEFDPPSYSKMVREDAEVDTVVETVTAVDIDVSENYRQFQ